jgi:hypothetical protein
VSNKRKLVKPKSYTINPAKFLDKETLRQLDEFLEDSIFTQFHTKYEEENNIKLWDWTTDYRIVYTIQDGLDFSMENDNES